MKKILLTLAAVVAVTAGVVGLSAFEAHIINVTAHIENALRVATDPIAFGTVFPQEYTTRTATVGLSESFMGQERINDVEYKIVQKPKPILDTGGKTVETTLGAAASVGATKIQVVNAAGMAVGDNIAIGYHGATMERGVIAAPAPVLVGSFFDVFVEVPLTNAHAVGEKVIVVYKDLCKFLSKMPDAVPGNDVGVPSYYHPAVGDNGQSVPASCSEPTNHVASGVLANYDLDSNLTGIQNDLNDTWTIDLKVPPVKGYVGQDWPASCQGYVVEQDSQDYGCDLWIEVTGFTKDGQPVPTPAP